MTVSCDSTGGLDFLLNGQRVPVQPSRPETTLLDIIRDRNLTGAKEGCAEGECGACMVLMVVPEGSGGSAYVPVNSCLMFARMAAGREIYTVESLGTQDKLCDVQRAMSEGGGSQCGYCTPGFVVSLFAEQYRPGRNGPCRVEALGGNLCRCTGYRPISDAARSLGTAPEGAFLDRLSRPAPPVRSFEYDQPGSMFARPETIADCLHLKSRYPDARFIAGGTDLAVESNIHGRRLPRLISVEAAAELSEFHDGADEVRIGAALPLSELEKQWTAAPEIVGEWLPLFASPSIRNRASLGGNLATASPIGDSAPLLIALDACIEVAGLAGRRIVPVAEFFPAYRRSALAPGELIVSVRIPKPLPLVARFFKVAKRRTDDISTVAAAFSLRLDSRGVAQDARIGLGGVAATPIRLKRAEEALIGHSCNDTSIDRAKAAMDADLRPRSDHRGSAEYRLEVAKSLLEKFQYELAERQR